MTDNLLSRLNNTENTGYLLYHLTIILERTMKRELDEIGITHTQFLILATVFRLREHSDTITQVDIATKSMTDKMMVSKVLRALEKKSWITRKEHPTDTRAKIIFITEEGEVLLRKAFQIVEKVNNQFFSPIDNKEAFNSHIKLLIAKNSS